MDKQKMGTKVNVDEIRKSIQYALQLEDALPITSIYEVMKVFDEVLEMAGHGILHKVNQEYVCIFIKKNDKWYTASQPTKELAICHAAMVYLNRENDDN